VVIPAYGRTLHSAVTTVNRAPGCSERGRRAGCGRSRGLKASNLRRQNKDIAAS